MADDTGFDVLYTFLALLTFPFLISSLIKIRPNLQVIGIVYIFGGLIYLYKEMKKK